MQTSPKGIAALEEEEGVVLKAYLCPAHHWTIGAGLTAASGVVKPKAGMVITKDAATYLLSKALRQNYEPTVEIAMSVVSGSKVTRPKQHEFDAGVSFHFNTGAIKRASWVKKWLADAARRDVRAALLLWTKGGGKVLPGLVKRRERESAMLLDGVYPFVAPVAAQPSGPVYATWALRMDPRAFAQAKVAFTKLGYDVGPMVDQILASSVRKFQADHALTVDGIIGRATLSTLQRRLDAPKAAAKPAAVGAVAAAAPAADSRLVDAVAAFDGAGWIALGLVGLWGANTAWRYRDVIAAKIARPIPRLATFLRSF